MAVSERTQIAIKNFVDLAESKKLNKNTIISIGVICGSAQMHEAGYTTEQAFIKATELLKANKSIEEIYKEILTMSGYNQAK